MKYFKELTELPTLNLWDEFNQLLDNNTISWHPHERDQICVNTVPGKKDLYTLDEVVYSMIGITHTKITAEN